jgi:hypothetical protein
MKPGYEALSHVDGKMHGGSTQSDPAWCTHGVYEYIEDLQLDEFEYILLEQDT